MFAEMLRVRDRIYRLLAGRQKPAATAHLHLLAGMLSGLLANASTDLGYRDAAAEQARAAWEYGDIIGHNGLLAWTRGMQSLIEYWSGRPQHAVRLAQSAARYADSATARVRLNSIEARAWSLLGDAREARRCMGAATDALNRPAGGDSAATRRADALRRAAPAKHQAATSRADAAIRKLVKNQQEISFRAVARTGGISLDFLYASTDLRSRIESLRARQVCEAPDPGDTAGRREASIVDSLTARLRQERTARLAAVRELEDKLAASHGELLRIRRILQQHGIQP
jgi:hypothetical protein